MAESLVKKDELQAKAKRKMLMAKLYLGIGVVVVVASIIGSYWIVSNRTQTTAEIAGYVKSNRDYSDASEQVADQLAIVRESEPRYNLATYLPANEQLTNLTRQFDDLFIDWNEPGNEILNNSIVFGTSVVDAELGVSVLPVSLTIESSADNFQRFLQTVETSGLPGSGLRLMDVQSISINLANQDAEDSLLSYTINLNAYFQAADSANNPAT